MAEARWFDEAVVFSRDAKLLSCRPMSGRIAALAKPFCFSTLPPDGFFHHKTAAIRAVLVQVRILKYSVLLEWVDGASY